MSALKEFPVHLVAKRDGRLKRYLVAVFPTLCEARRFADAFSKDGRQHIVGSRLVTQVGRHS